MWEEVLLLGTTRLVAAASAAASADFLGLTGPTTFTAAFLSCEFGVKILQAIHTLGHGE